jgi:hypothetical protein
MGAEWAGRGWLMFPRRQSSGRRFKRFAAALDSRASALRRDECGDWAIRGTNGHIYAVPEGFQLMIGCDFGYVGWTSARGWESAKKRLGFGNVTQDGDCEGSIILDRHPSKPEAAEIRDILGIPKRVELSEGQLANLRCHAAANAFKPLLPAPGDERVQSGRPSPGTRNGAFLMEDDGDFDGGGYEGGDDTPEPEDKTRSVPTCIRNNHFLSTSCQ